MLLLLNLFIFASACSVLRCDGMTFREKTFAEEGEMEKCGRNVVLFLLKDIPEN